MTTGGVHPHDMFDDHPALTAFARDLAAAAAATPAPAVGVALASVLEGGMPVLRSDVPIVKAPRRAGRLRWAVGGVVFGLGVGSLGVAGALPGPVQKQVSRVAGVVGVDLPDGTPDPAPPATTPRPLPVTSLPTLPPAAPSSIPRPSAPPAVGHGQDRPDPSVEHGSQEGPDDAEEPSDPAGHPVTADEQDDPTTEHAKADSVDGPAAGANRDERADTNGDDGVDTDSDPADLTGQIGVDRGAAASNGHGHSLELP